MRFWWPLLAVWIHLSSEALVPNYSYYLDTISTCTEWYDNSGDYSCTKVRDVLGISPANFTRWNPSVTLDVCITNSSLLMLLDPASRSDLKTCLTQESLSGLRFQISDLGENRANFLEVSVGDPHLLLYLGSLRISNHLKHHHNFLNNFFNRPHSHRKAESLLVGHRRMLARRRIRFPHS